uniref:Zinc finger protein 418 n=1 Tax=Cacopsylla melanoneura TaxID=428564 RepID=A0A8D8YZ28_9HEMI
MDIIYKGNKKRGRYSKKKEKKRDLLTNRAICLFQAGANYSSLKSKMSIQHFTSIVKSEIQPGMYTTTYITRQEDGHERQVTFIEQKPLDIPCNDSVKQEPGELLNVIQDTPLVQEELVDVKSEKNYVADKGEEGFSVQNNKRERLLVNGHYPCDKCLKTLASKASLRVHQLTHKGLRFTCTKCWKSFSQKGQLKKHLQSHKGIRYPCKKCPKSFIEKRLLNRHLSSHAGIIYSCDQCFKQFARKDSLQRHVLVHKKSSELYEKKYHCDKCPRSFSQKGNIIRHLRSHDRVRYPCEQCSKSFSQKGDLTRHRQGVHEGLKFKCNRCSKYFLAKQTLQNHLLNNKCLGILQIKYTCIHCKKSYTRKERLKRHLQDIHNMNIVVLGIVR